MPSASAGYQPIPHSYQLQASPSRHPSNIAGPSFIQSPHRNMAAVAGGVVGPEAAGLDPSSAEHFFVTLAAYADALDALPLDLTRSFSDLRELDAVLGSHLNSLTSRLHHLTALIEDDTIDRGQRLLALKEVAEEARAYKMGGEDKIRVALNTAETIIGHTDFIDALVEQLDQFPELSPLLNPKKHLNIEQYYGPEGARLRELLAASVRAGNTSSGSGHGGLAGAGGIGRDANGTGSSHKKKKVAASAMGAGKGARAADNVSLTGSQASAGPTPSKKRKTVGGSSGTASSNVAGSSKVARTASNTGAKDEEEDWPRSAINPGKAGNGTSSSSKKKGESNSKSSASANANVNNRLPRAAHVSGGYLEGEEDESKRENNVDGHATSRSRTSRPVRGAAADGRSDEEEDDAEEDDDTKRSARRGGSNRTPRVAQVGAAAGASPYTAPGSGSTSASRAESPASMGGAANDDADETRYCFCNNVSYGDMIGCDDDDCEREWFHLGCVGLTKPPQGTWYCDACLERRAGSGRNKKKGKNGKYETITSTKSKSSSRR